MTARSFCLGPFPQWGLSGWAHFPALLTELWEKSFMGIWPNSPVHWVVAGVGLCLLYLPMLMLLLKCPILFLVFSSSMYTWPSRKAQFLLPEALLTWQCSG